MNDLNRLTQALADRYTIEGEIGSGGMATVYLAQDLKHHRSVAVKVFDPDGARSLGAERFLREIKTAANLTHPHILPLFDSGQANDFLFYAMPFVEGESLRERLLRETQLPIDEAVRIATEVADALGHAHGRGVIHRDIKPENVLLSEGHALVADFGIALAVESAGVDRLTAAGVPLGTPSYMSPEQVEADGPLDGRADLYSLACVLFEMLVGEPPFTGPTDVVILARHLAAPVPPVRAARPDVPESLALAVEKALSKLPADRHSSAKAFVEALTRGSSHTQEERLSIAVLPFANMSTNPENEYLSDGISEEIINALAQLSDMRVVARTSSFSFKGKGTDVREIGAKLQVDKVLEGSVRRAGNRLRVTAQLINVGDGCHLWSERYDREMEDVFAVQDEIAASVVDKLEVSLLRNTRVASAQRHPRNPEAYELYLRGRHFWNRRGLWLTKGLGYLQQAVELEPGFALGHIGVADAYAMLGVWGGTKNLAAFQKAREAADRALALGPEMAEAHACLGFVAMYHDWDWSTAEEKFRLALEQRPNYLEAYLWKAQFLGWVKGDFDAGLSQVDQARNLDPLSPMVITTNATILLNTEPEKALREADRAIELGPTNPLAHIVRAHAHTVGAGYEEYRTTLEDMIAQGPVHPYIIAGLAILHAKEGEKERALGVIRDHNLGEIQPFYTAVTHAAMNDVTSTFEWLETAYERRDPLLPILRATPFLRALQEDRRFADLLQRLGLQ